MDCKMVAIYEPLCKILSSITICKLNGSDYHDYRGPEKITRQYPLGPTHSDFKPHISLSLLSHTP